MKAILGSILCGCIVTFSLAAQAQETAESQAAMTPAAALARLKAGNERFATNKTEAHDWISNVHATAGGQYPFAAVLACMDSREPVEILFDQTVGELFAVRVAGNVVNEDELGSLEYAAHAGTKLFVVLGHTRCGAVKGALDNTQLGNLTPLLTKIHPAIETAQCHDAKSDPCVNAVVEANVRNSIAEIRARSPLLAHELEEKKIALVGGVYDVSTGRVQFLDSP